jgi:membrane-bound lytic murein transglycosylase B
MKIITIILTIGIFLSGSDSIESNEEVRLQQLVDHFDNKGIDIQPLIDDERFALVEDITSKFTRAVEIKIETFQDYQQAINYDRKKDKIAIFYSEYHQELKSAEAEYGIPKEVIIGILAVESEFGRYKGSYNPFNAYVSMYVEEYRTNWTLAQLEELIKFADKKELDILEMKSSYAGAMSYAQFIPWSLNRFWVGSELYHMPDNINSVANYLAHYKNVTGSLEKSVLRYNPSTMYQQAVLALADDAEEILSTVGN